MNPDSINLTQRLIELRNENNLDELRKSILDLRNQLNTILRNMDEQENINELINGKKKRSEYIHNDLTQIYESQTIERGRYYLDRLIKSLTEIKTGKINDINLLRWKEYDEIITDSLWIIDKRDNSGAHNASYWGNFIPQIPHQLLLRYTKKDDWVVDTFLGSGTTLIECKRLGRNGIGIELLPEVAAIAATNVQKENNLFSIDTKAEIVVSDSIELNYAAILNKYGISSCQFAIMHPPYWDIIKFSEDPRDLSNADNLSIFLEKMSKLAEKVYQVLEEGRYCALVIGDKYNAGEWIPLGFLTMNEYINKGFLLKSIIVKNFEETKGKVNQKELWRYRALVGGFYIFKHEYIFLFKKGKGKKK